MIAEVVSGTLRCVVVADTVRGAFLAAVAQCAPDALGEIYSVTDIEDPSDDRIWWARCEPALREAGLWDSMGFSRT